MKGVKQQGKKELATPVKKTRRPQTYSNALPRGPANPPKTYHDVFEPARIPEAAWDNFIKELSERGHVTHAAAAAGIKRITCYKHREVDHAFAARWTEAHVLGLERLEDEAVRRSVEGVDRGIYYQGECVATEKEYSDSLLQFLLQGNNAKYKRRQEITGADGGPLLALLGTMNDAELDIHIEQRRRELEEASKAE